LEKTDQQAVITATMVNAKRLFALAAEDPEEGVGEALREALLAAWVQTPLQWARAALIAD
jgi:hypothetical protein